MNSQRETVQLVVNTTPQRDKISVPEPGQTRDLLLTAHII